jgi:hypothetical protein
MMGTLAAVAAAKGIKTSAELYRAEVAGDVEAVEGVLKITRIQVHYFLKVPATRHQDVQDAFKVYLARCPAAQSVIGCIAIEDELTLEDMP